jgi:hypothetical protein
MTRFLLTCFAICLALLFAPATRAQNFNGQWKGHFKVTGAEDRDEYMLELQATDPTHVTGFSYTYFDEAGFRYFTICRVSGIIDRADKTVTVTELERIKGNTPPGIRDCLQVHTLTYFKGEDGETLEGTWKPAPGFDHGCGSGTTLLSRKMLVHTRPKTGGDSTLAAGKPPVVKKKVKTLTPSAKIGASAGSKPLHNATAPHPTTAPSISSAPPAKGIIAHKAPAHKPAPARSSAAPTLRKDTSALPATMQEGNTASLPKPPGATQAIISLPPQVRRRNNDVIQTIEISSPEIRIELYDDGIIDHDTVTVYFNGKAVIWKNMLSHHAISLTLTALPDRENDLILYADNLGDIPPNTALMVVYAGDDKYDIRVTSDEQKNGEVKFRLKKGK